MKLIIRNFPEVIPIHMNPVFLWGWGDLRRVGADSEQGDVPEMRRAVVQEGSSGHSVASRPFPELRRNLMSHGKSEVEVREWSQADGWRKVPYKDRFQ